MRILAATAVALLVSIAGVPLVLRFGSNAGPLAGVEIPSLIAVALLTAITYYFAARRSEVARVPLLVQSVVVAVVAPLLVLFGPLAFCVALRPGASCM